jgi:hypothetical protein
VEGGSRGGLHVGAGVGWGVCMGEGFSQCILYWGLFINRSNMGLCKSVKVSFICSFLLLKLYMWKRSKALSK